jgi:capsular polysaccharide biosynthesis protein
MNKKIFEKLSLPSKSVSRKKPINFNVDDKHIFEREFNKHLPNFSPILDRRSYVSPCARLLNGLFFNSFQFNTKLKFIWLLKLYLKFFINLFKIRKITQFNKILFITNSHSSYNFFHWNMDVLAKLEFIDKVRDQILESDLKIIIPNDHSYDYIKKTLQAFDINFYFQKKNELIFAKNTVLLTDIAPTGNFHKDFILKLNIRMRNHFYNIKTINFDKKKIYISRKNAKRRVLKNENEIIPILKKNGFTIVDFDILNFEEQLSYILNCEILVGVHGSGLTHMLWMKPKSKILEIRTRNNDLDNCFFTLASDLDHDYSYTFADKIDPKKSNHLSDLSINVDEFSVQLQKILN